LQFYAYIPDAGGAQNTKNHAYVPDNRAKMSFDLPRCAIGSDLTGKILVQSVQDKGRAMAGNTHTSPTYKLCIICGLQEFSTHTRPTLKMDFTQV